MQIRWLGHSAFEITDGSTNLLIDPFISYNPVCPVQADELNPQYILVTHFHPDHVGDTEALAKRTGALVITTHECALALQEQGVNAHGMAIGGKKQFPFGTVRVTMAFHGSGVAGGHAAGYVINIGGKRIYHAGDTCLFSDMKLLNGVIEPGIDVAMIPVGDNYTMGADDAAIAVEWISPKVVIPMHFGTFPVLTPDASDFVSRVAKLENTRAAVLKPGEIYEI